MAHDYPPDPIPGYLLGASVNLISGAPGAGKSRLLALIACILRDGGKLFGQQLSGPMPVGIFSADRSFIQSTRYWFALAGFPHIACYSLQDDPEFNARLLRKKADRITLLENHLEQIWGGPIPWGAILLLDTATPFLGGNLIDYDACMVACMELRQLARKYGMTILGTTHSPKQKADPSSRYARWQDRIAGSVAQLGYTDTQMYLAEPHEVGPKETNHLFYLASHHRPPLSIRLFPRPDGLFEVVEGSQESVIVSPSVNADGVLAAIESAADGTAFATIVSWGKAHDVSQSTVRRHLNTLQGDNRVVRLGHGRYRRVQPS